MDVQITISAVQQGKIVLGFSNDAFSQAIFLPVSDIKEVETMALGFYNAIVTAAEEALGIPAPKVNDASINNSAG